MKSEFSASIWGSDKNEKLVHLCNALLVFLFSFSFVRLFFKLGYLHVLYTCYSCISFTPVPNLFFAIIFLSHLNP